MSIAQYELNIDLRIVPPELLMLFAENPNIGEVTGPIGTVFGGVVLLLYLYDKITASRKQRRLSDIEVESKELEADELPSKQYQRAAQAAERRAQRLEDKVSRMDLRIDKLQKEHQDCEERFNKQEKRCEDEMQKLREEGVAQQTTITKLQSDITKMKQRMKDAGLNGFDSDPAT